MTYRTHADIINAWPSLAEFADDHGEKYDTVKGWRRREMIPSNRWQKTIDVASERGIPGVDLETLERTQRVVPLSPSGRPVEARQ